MENSISKEIKEVDEFEQIHKEYKELKKKLQRINQEKRDIEIDIKKITQKLQNSCNHIFFREETTSGCYREVHNICSICRLWA